MAWDANSIDSGLLAQRGQSGSVVTSDEVAGRIVNMELTERGTLRSVRGPLEYHPASWGAQGPSDTDYASPHLGIFHCRTEGGLRDILLAHFDGGIWVHEPWASDWALLIGDSADSPEIASPLPEADGRPSFLTQFEATPNGVIIVPQGARAFFYDGSYIAPLGFDTAPGAPTAWGPRVRQVYDANGLAPDEYDIANQKGYAHNGREWIKADWPVEWETGAPPAVGTYRLGSIDNAVFSNSGSEKLNNPMGGVLQDGEWRAAVQFGDCWGNLSPIGGMSAPVRIHREDNLVKERKKDSPESADRMRMQCAWADLPLGPPHTLFRNILRTKDQLHTDLPGLFWLPPNSTTGGSTFATLEDNRCDVYPDNIPDSWLVLPAKQVEPMPTFRLCKLGFGRVWFANTTSEPGRVCHSWPGMWGSVQPGTDVYPDATGAAVTGIHAAASGMLFFTETSTYLATPNDSGVGPPVYRTISPVVGCVAPNSIKTMLSGLTVWLGRDGFYSYDGNKVVPVSEDIKDDVLKRVNSTWRLRAVAGVEPRMGEYRCWVPVDGARVNNLCLVFDGSRWRERTDIKAAAVCVTRDDRQLMLALGTVATTGGDHDSVWVLDHEAKGVRTPSARNSIVETSWLRSVVSRRSSTPTQLDLWLRESTSGEITVEVMRDWRQHPLVAGAGEGPKLYPDQDTPPFWDTAVYDEDYANPMSGTTIPRHLVKRRPFWTNVALYVPSCEAFKVRLTYAGDMEFVGMAYTTQDRRNGGANLPEGT